MSSSLHKMQAAWMPNAQHTHPWLITRHAANSLFDFIDVLKIYGGRRSSEAEITWRCSFHPSPGDRLPSSVLLLGLEGWGVLLHDRRAVCHLPCPRDPDTTHTGIAITMCLPGTKAALALQKQNFCLSLLPPELHAAAAKQALCYWTCSASPSIAANHPAPSSSLCFPREYTMMVAQGKRKGRSSMLQPRSAPSPPHSNSGC